MGEARDKILLHPIEPDHLLIINEDENHAGENDGHQNRKHNHIQPGIRISKLSGVNIAGFKITNKGIIGLKIGTDIKKQRCPKGHDGKDEYKNRVEEPPTFKHKGA